MYTNIQYVYKYVLKIQYFKMFKVHIYPRKFYLKNLNVFMPKVGF